MVPVVVPYATTDANGTHIGTTAVPIPVPAALDLSLARLASSRAASTTTKVQYAVGSGAFADLVTAGTSGYADSSWVVGPDARRGVKLRVLATTGTPHGALSILLG
jgi:hypothetical protein